MGESQERYKFILVNEESKQCKKETVADLTIRLYVWHPRQFSPGICCDGSCWAYNRSSSMGGIELHR